MSNLSERLASLSPEKRDLLSHRLREKAQTGREPGIVRRPEQDPAPLSFAQQRMWFLDQLEPASPLYTIPAALRLRGRLHVRALEQALNEIIRRHEGLRATFDSVDGNPVQRIAPVLSLTLPIVDLRSLPASQVDAEALRLAREEAGRPFDLSRGPLIRASLLRLDVEEHVILLTMHHIISDGWSIGVLARELAALYGAFAAGRPSPLGELPIQYADYAYWQRQWLQGENLERQLAYWRQQLAGSPDALDMPTDRPRPSIQSFRGAHHSFSLPPAVSKGLVSLCREARVTSFMALLAAFATLLHRYTGQEDICVGTPIANRNRAEIEGLIGLFVNTLVLRTDLSGDPSFRTLLARVRETTLRAYNHQDLPFEMLVDELQPERELNRTPLFQVMFDLQGPSLRGLELPGLKLSLMDVERGTSKFEMVMAIVEEADGLKGTLEFDTDLFDAATAARLITHYQTLLEGVVADPDRHLSALPLLGQAERRQLLVEWNDTAARYPQDQCIHQLIEAQVERTPNSIAVATDGASLTYRELNRQADTLARHLQSLGVGPDVPVAICARRSLELIIGLLGILKAGGAYVPLDPAYPTERLEVMLQDSQTPIILTQAKLLPKLPTHQAEVLCLDPPWQQQGEPNERNLSTSVTPGHLAYILYTSGSTGRPKGVAIEHHSAAALLTWAASLFSPEDLSGVLAATSICFDLSVFEIFLPLTRGGRVLLVESALDLPSFSLANEVTLVNTVPSAMAELLRAQGLPPSVRTVNLAGEPLPHSLVQRIYAETPVERVFNLYGPTEDTTYSTSALINKHDPRPPSIGRPIANTQVYVLDQHLQPTPVGVPGILHLGGAGLAREYLNRPDLTAERFIPMPHSLLAETTAPSLPPEADRRQHATPDTPYPPRLYNTGDLARYRPDGNIEFLGRIDHQVKIRGFRIELGEIEAVLRAHPALRETVVVAREDHSGNQRLVANVVADHMPAQTSHELRAFLERRLPAYMIPSAFVTLDALPLTPNGKVDRRALPAPERAGQDAAAGFVAPKSPLEELVAGIWAEVLGLERVGRHDNFFGLGGHSLLATRVVSRLRSACKVDIPLRSLFETPTVAGLARGIVAARPDAASLDTPIEARGRGEDAPLSFAQQRLWFLDQLEPGSPLYNVPAAVRLRGTLDIEALKRSLNEVVRRHEVLRTTFPTENGRPRQVITPQLTLELQLIDLGHWPGDRREAQAQRLAADIAQQPFDLARGPLVRAMLLRLAETEHIALLTMHHIVTDGWSIEVLVREMSALYRAFVAGLPSPLPELPIQYADYAHWQRQWLQGEVRQQQLSYWRERLAGATGALDLPTDRPRPAVQTFRGTAQTVDLPAPLIRAIRALCQREGVTLYMALLAAFQTLLHRYTGQDDICVGAPVANRNRAEIEGLIGFFVNTLVLRTDLSGDPTFRQLLGRVREVALGAYAHQDLPFEMLIDELQPARDMSRTPLFQVMLDLQRAPLEALELPGLSLSLMQMERRTAKFDLLLAMVEQADGLSATFEYNTDLFDAATIARMARHLQTLLEGAVADPDRHLAALPILDEEERQQLLVEWNDTAADYPRDEYLPKLFEAQVERTPDSTAVEYRGQGLTYHELNRRANQLARYLQRLGVGPDVLVGICLERSLEMIVGVLGTLKAGGAYLPLDPAYPEERLRFILQDAGVSVLLTQDSSVERLLLDGVAVVRLDTDWPVIERESAENPVSGLTAEALAYTIYTSGSTGRPKGVMIRHRSVLNLATALHRAIYTHHPGIALRISLNAPLPFDASVQQLAMLLHGHTLCLIPDEVRTDGNQLLAYLREHRIDLLDCVPSQLKLLLAAGLLDGRGQAPSIVLPGGEAIDDGTWQTLANAAKIQFFNMYGPTECAVDSTACCVHRAARRPVIGRPVTNAQFYVLDQNREPVPIGVPGELYIGGAGVARGYLNRPDLTAERFIPLPPSLLPEAATLPLPARSQGDLTHHAPRITDHGSRITHHLPLLYRTGDLVRWLPDGNLEFLGRIDHQVKIRGFRVELGEIESVLAEHPGLRDVAVCAREDRPGDRRLVAYLVPKEGVVAPGAGELRSFLQQKLPDYMLPAAFVTLEALPLLPNGKLDRRALPAPDQVRPDLDQAYVAPRTPQEATLAAIWTEVLGIERVGIHDSFFELGGDSILAIQVIARAQQAGMHLAPRQLFQAPTIAELATLARSEPAALAEQGIVEGPFPPTPIQRWFFAQNLSEPHHWNQSLLLQVEHPLAPAHLRTAVQHLLTHHDALRLRARQEAESWEVAIARPDQEVPFEWIDLSGVGEGEQARRLQQATAKLQASLDLGRGPLVRVAYFGLGPKRPGRLFIVIHHLAVDSVSWRVLLEDLLTAYQQSSHGQTPQLPAKTTSIRQWAQRLVEYAQSDEIREELGYWQAALGQDPAPLPIDNLNGDKSQADAPRPTDHESHFTPNTEASARSVTVALGAEETSALLQEVPATYHSEINDALLTATAQTLAAWSGSRTVLIDVEGHGREDLLEGLDVSRTVGWFTAMYPLRLLLPEGAGPGEALSAVREQLRKVPRRGIGWGLLRYLSNDERIRARMAALPQPEVSFNYLGQLDHALPGPSPFRPAPESTGEERSPKGQRPHRLQVSGAVVGGQLRMVWAYSQDLHRQETIERLAAGLVEALRALIAHCRSAQAARPSRATSLVTNLSEKEIAALVAELNEARQND